MGLLGEIGKIVIGGALGGPGGAIAAFTVEHGAQVLEGTIDVVRQIVKIGKDVYRAIPPEAFALTGQPLHGLLKHEAEDELILLGEIAGEIAIFSGLAWPALGPIGATLAIAEGAIPVYVTVGSLVGKLHHRLLDDQEWEMAQYIFRESLFDREDIILTNLGGIGGSKFVYPSTLGSIFVNMGNAYVHNAKIVSGPLLFHELTHVWQAKQNVLKEIFLYGALPDAGVAEAYEFTPGRQWSEYRSEQQASIVEAWALGATERNPLFDIGARKKISMNSPLFRYINANVRRSDNGARTARGHSTRQLLREGRHRTMKDMCSRPPQPWW